MKSRKSLTMLLLLACSTLALAQSDAQKSFDKLKTLAGTWTGSVVATPAQQDWNGATIWLSMRVTSRGNAIVHEIKKPGTPDDVTKDDPITMLYLDGDHLTLTHYCDAGNRPRMIAKPSADGKTIEFDLADVTGNMQYGHMHHSVFTIVDEDHHSEEWTFMGPGDTPIHARMNLTRVTQQASAK